MQIEMISAYGQLEVEDKENGKNNAVRPAMWVTWQSDMQVYERFTWLLCEIILS